MKTRRMGAKIAVFTFLLATVIGVTCPSASARFFGNRPESGGAAEAEQSRELARRSLTIISQVYQSLADYESSSDAARLNGALTELAAVLRAVASEYERLGREGTDLKLSPDLLVKQIPQSVNLLEYFGQKASELDSLSTVALKMAEEERNLATSLEKVRFDGKSDPETVLTLYDALERLQYLAALYAKANQTASP
jgi:hypothetical protein